VTRVFLGYRAALDAVSWHRLRSSAAQCYNLIGKEGQFRGFLARKRWAEDAGGSNISLQRILHSSMEMGAKGGTGRSFCLLGWSYDKNIFSIILRDDSVVVSFLVNACFIFTCLDVSRGNKLKLMLQKREGK